MLPAPVTAEPRDLRWFAERVPPESRDRSFHFVDFRAARAIEAIHGPLEPRQRALTISQHLIFSPWHYNALSRFLFPQPEPDQAFQGAVGVRFSAIDAAAGWSISGGGEEAAFLMSGEVLQGGNAAVGGALKRRGFTAGVYAQQSFWRRTVSERGYVSHEDYFDGPFVVNPDLDMFFSAAPGELRISHTQSGLQDLIDARQAPLRPKRETLISLATGGQIAGELVQFINSFTAPLSLKYFKSLRQSLSRTFGEDEALRRLNEGPRIPEWPRLGLLDHQNGRKRVASLALLYPSREIAGRALHAIEKRLRTLPPLFVPGEKLRDLLPLRRTGRVVAAEDGGAFAVMSFHHVLDPDDPFFRRLADQRTNRNFIDLWAVCEFTHLLATKRYTRESLRAESE